MLTNAKPRISLVGAGPGDPGLITLKGVQALQSAGIVLYDALVNTALLEHAPVYAPRVFVGKRAGKHHCRQEEINRLLVACARRYGHVVRLKGGDPFILGRGHEELEHARGEGIETAVIPGISSATALAGLQGVPVTRRGISESFWVITGATRNGDLSADIALAARSTATVIILMGARRLREIGRVFAEQGRGDTPALIIQNGSLPDERRALAPIARLAQKAEAAGLGAPAVIIVGPVAALHPDWEDIRQAVGQPDILMPAIYPVS
jgi:uroporphyrin-III C-methyltransferase